MLESKNIESFSENEWKSIDTFISDFAKNNEDIGIEAESESVKVKKHKSVSSTLKQKQVRLNPVISTNPVSDIIIKKEIDSSEDFSEKYQGLHSEIKNLLVELQEVKKARIDLQAKLESLR